MIFVEELKEYFNENYSYIYHSLSDDDLQNFINRYRNVDKVEILANSLVDYILSQSLENEIEE